MTFPTEEINSFHDLFWQYPVITEKKFFEQNRDDDCYIGLPWATLIDKKININEIIKSITIFIDKDINYYTCCQHIHFRRLLPLFKVLNINCLYTPHKIKGEDNISDIIIKPCPLYAVNIEDESRNSLFKNVDFLECERELLYSFIGAYNPNIYISKVRENLYSMNHPSNTIVENSNGWFYENVVYSKKQNSKGEYETTDEYDNNTEKYNKVLLNSRYSLCPSGSGPNTIRFWESLGCGAIPVLLSNTLELPENKLWDEAIVRVDEKDFKKIPEILGEISTEQEKNMRTTCLKLYANYKKNFANSKKYNMVVFSNCHGEKYIEIFKRNSNIETLFNIKYIVSYQQLDNFNEYKQLFSNADILIINNIKNYQDYTIKNLKKILKPTVQLIVIPFIRFEGYWIPESYKQLQYIGGNTVSYFPDISCEEIEEYITREENTNIIINHFEKSLEKLKKIEYESDINFYDFFIKNHRKIPFFRDNYHPTMNMLEFVGQEILKQIKNNLGNEFYYSFNDINLLNEPKEYGHYKPIQDNVAKVLGLEFDLDMIFICDRRYYLRTIITIEDNKKKIKDLDDMREKYFNNI